MLRAFVAPAGRSARSGSVSCAGICESFVVSQHSSTGHGHEQVWVHVLRVLRGRRHGTNGARPGWRCLFANDFSAKKAAAYRANFPPATDLVVQDIRKLTADDLPGQAMLAWASFPCQDLSLAGERRGLSGDRSGTFWPFWNLDGDLSSRERRVPIIVLENVVGALTSRGGRDFSSIVERLADSGYRVGALVNADAALWVPSPDHASSWVAVDRNVETPSTASRRNRTRRGTLARCARLTTASAMPRVRAGRGGAFRPPQRSTTLMDVGARNPQVSRGTLGSRRRASCE
ncbi:MAG: DNA cytosine methyltransferase [Planctomycetota bacterium]